MTLTERSRACDHVWDPPEPDENQERPQVCAACKTKRFSIREPNGTLRVRRYLYAGLGHLWARGLTPQKSKEHS